MARFYFNLEGKQNVDDPGGLAFESELQAFRAAQPPSKGLSECSTSAAGYHLRGRYTQGPR